MRRVLFGIVVWVGVIELAAAQTPMQPMIPATNQVGVSAAVRGRVELSRPGAVGRVVQSGEPIFLGDEISTDAGGGLQIILLDETVFTIGPNSAIIIDEFVYDPSTDAGKIGATAVKGVFRFISGKIAHKDPNAMKVKLPVGLIGIRGTMVAGRITGQHSLVVLLGPGDKNNTGDRPGHIAVSNEVGVETRVVNVTRAGYGTEIAGPNVAPTPPVLIPSAQMDALTEDLEAPEKSDKKAPEKQTETAAETEEEGEPAEEGVPDEQAEEEGAAEPGEEASPDQEAQAEPASYQEPEASADQETAPTPVLGQGESLTLQPGELSAGQLAGQDTIAILADVVALDSLTDLTQDLTDETDQSAQDTADTAAAEAATVADGIATFDQIQTITTGKFHFVVNEPNGLLQTRSGGSDVSKTGLFQTKVDVNFGARTVGGGNSFLKVGGGTTSISQSIHDVSVPSKAFGSGSSDAVFSYSTSELGVGESLTLDLTLKNADGTIGKTAKLVVTHDADSPITGEVATGTKDDVTRTTGLAP